MLDNPQQTPVYTCTLQENDWRIVLAGLTELPFKISAGTIARVEQQLMGQRDVQNMSNNPQNNSSQRPNGETTNLDQARN